MRRGLLRDVLAGMGTGVIALGALAAVVLAFARVLAGDFDAAVAWFVAWVFLVNAVMEP